MLKSDQDGIESIVVKVCNDDFIALKSDQDGIEIPHNIRKIHNLLLVKIRPRWD